MEFTGSPTKRKQLASSFNVFDDGLGVDEHKPKRSASTMPLMTSRFMNQLPKGKAISPDVRHLQSALLSQAPPWAYLVVYTLTTSQKSPVDDLLVRLSEQQAVLNRQKNEAGQVFDESSSSSGTDPYASPAEKETRPDAAEVLKLKKELEFARERMAQMDFQLTQSNIARHTVEQAIGSPFPAAQRLAISDLQTGFQYQAGHDGPSNRFAHPGMQNVQPTRPQQSRLSLAAQEFGFSWGAPAPQTAVTYMSTTEPLNYRRLLDRNMSCNWKYIVDKIVCANDQQASIFLQQKLKVGTIDQKFEIVQAIIDQAYPLMINRFGNFLVQRCFEHGTPEQIVAIAQAIRGNTLSLSMDAFGCHVVQKAFDSVPEEYKAIMVHELLRRIPETVIHRYACHVWQKLFELRWSDSPPQIMKYVNEALRGMWHEVALGETGSLVVQNIFENCLEEDKRPCITEVLGSIDVVAHGQFGNWCIQHICEHGAIPDRTRAIDHVIRFADQYSMDQFASKVVEKCLKVSGNDFLDRYLNRVCEANPERPRMPLIDISGDQFGNYLIQYILTNADPQRREVVAAHIRKHMVSLRGSKYGSRVAMLCCNPAYATRPGPPSGLPAPTRSTTRYGDYFGGSEPPRQYAERPYGGNERQYGMGGRSSGYPSYR
ncbi:hypothetical protein LTR10_000771 [Elasticomyces elasticus]|nr:hypothetical protein LTR10_000771 [Elasticomyces elasticus]KAK4979982.1 hypothetical protein LTR42_000289 [Elasticomyces elasticus]